ncbi:MAG: phosphotransferase family protein [Deltaproteobacteria bacterium]
MEITDVDTLKKSSRDPAEMRRGLEVWMAQQLPKDSRLMLGPLSSPSATGMSSETLLFDAEWQEEGTRRRQAFVARVAPVQADVPVFPEYDLERQFRAMRLVAEHSDVPVPVARWLETGSEALGAPFFVMERIEGRVPPDIMPYPFGSWLKDASKEEQRTLQNATIGVLASLHAIDRTKVDTAFLELDRPGATPLRRMVAEWRFFYDWMRENRSIPVADEGFAWLEENWPADEGDTVISWGDSRIGNILFDGFLPAAVLDWEMVSVGPRGLDLGWCIFLHSFFDDLAGMAGLEGMNDFMRSEDVAAEYERASGHRVPDLLWYEVFAAVRHAAIMGRIHSRRVHFEGTEWPTNLDDVVPHAALLRKMMAR